MSFVVKGLDIPNKGETLKIEILPDGSILKNVHCNTWIFLKEEQSTAVQLSNNHGRLTDIDAIYRAVSKCAENETDERKMEVYAQLMGLLLQAPTILEEEDAGK